MDASTKQACFDEISHQICDSDAKVSINDISSNWKVNLRESERLLWAWHEQHKEKAVAKEFLIRGIDVQGHCVISVIKESQLATVEKIFPKCTSSLFSLELPTPHCNRLGTHQLSNAVVVNLPIEPTNRCGTSKADKPAAAKPIVTHGANKPAPKAEPPKASPPKEKHNKTEAETLKTEPETPKKESAKPSTSKTAAKQAPATGKSSIASFFAKPKASTTAPKVSNKSSESAGATKPIEPKAATAKEEPMDTTPSCSESTKTPVKTKSTHETKHADAKSPSTKAAPVKKPHVDALLESRKRSLAALVSTDDEEYVADEIPATPKPATKRKKSSASKKEKEKEVSKQEAARALASSSDEDEIPGTPNTANISKKANGSRSSAPSSKRRKATRTVTRTFEDEDGYIKTVKETEEYSCSEEENQPDNSAAKAAVGAKTPAKLRSPTKPQASKITPPKGKGATGANGKQGSIMNFFKKK